MLDSTLLVRAAPPGSMRYFAVQYAEPEQRAALEAVYVIDAELHASANAAHEIAHTRLQWWQEEIDRLIAYNPRHPATQALLAAIPNADFSKVPQLHNAVGMELARITYQSTAELDGYLQRRGMALEIALQPEEPRRQSLRKLGGLLRRVETLRDLVFEARNGRVFWPLDELQKHQLTVQHLQSKIPSPQILQIIRDEAARVRVELQQLTSALQQATFRPALVLARLHYELLGQIEQTPSDVFTRRVELSPFKKVWTAWRAARLS
jgi:15-cis-phytoene synthase